MAITALANRLSDGLPGTKVMSKFNAKPSNVAPALIKTKRPKVGFGHDIIQIFFCSHEPRSSEKGIAAMIAHNG